MAKVFVSYSRKDSDFADQLIQNLGANGIDAWVDRQNIEGGDLWQAAISEAVAACEVFLVLLSPACIESVNVAKELSLAETHKRPILPILLNECQIPPAMEYQLAGIQYVKFAGTTYQDGFERLLKALRARHGVDAPAAPVTPQAAAPAPPASSLQTLLCGRWDIEAGNSLVGQTARLTLDFYPTGEFRGQLMTALGMSWVDGRWQVGPAANDVVLQGVQSNGLNNAQYVAAVQFNQISPSVLSGISAQGEQVVCRRIG